MDIPVPSSSLKQDWWSAGRGRGARTLDGQEEREGKNRNVGLRV